jgi:hypothetical protein
VKVIAAILMQNVNAFNVKQVMVLEENAIKMDVQLVLNVDKIAILVKNVYALNVMRDILII